MFDFLGLIRLFAFVFALTGLPGLGFAQEAIAEETTAPPAATQDDEFLPVDPAQLETVSGKKLMLGAYGVIFIVLAGYTAALWRREKRLEKNISHLAQRTGVNDTSR